MDSWVSGVLFEDSPGPSRRAQVGVRYTGRVDILLVVERVLMAPLRRRGNGNRRRGWVIARPALPVLSLRRGS